MLADPANRAIAIEARADRTARIARNALALGAPALSVVTGKAPHALEDLPAPDAVFVGGGGTAPGVDRPGRRRASSRRAARRQRGDARDAGGLGRVARVLGRGARADRDGARRAGRALPRLARRDADRSMALDEAMTPFRMIAWGAERRRRAPAPLVAAGRGGGSRCGLRLYLSRWTAGKAWPDPPPWPSPTRGEGTRSPARGKAASRRELPAIPPEAVIAATSRSASAAGRAFRARRSPRSSAGRSPSSARRRASGACSRSPPRREEPGLVEAARLIGATLDAAAARSARRLEAARILTPSPAVQARFGVPAVAEAAALAGAGAGGKLLGPRLAADGATCAVALSAELS